MVLHGRNSHTVIISTAVTTTTAAVATTAAAPTAATYAAATTAAADTRDVNLPLFGGIPVVFFYFPLF